MSWFPVDKSALDQRDWKDQYRRVLRWRKRLDAAKPTDDLSAAILETYQDFAHAFFINCYHLRDWLIGAGISKGTVDVFVGGNPCLVACRGICNRAKHFHLTKILEPERYREYLTTMDGVAVTSSTGFSGGVTNWAPPGSQPGDYVVETLLGHFKYSLWRMTVWWPGMLS